MGLTCLGPSPYPMYPNVPIEKHPRHCQWVTTIISSIISSSTYIVTHIICIYIYNYIYGICPFICGFYIFKFFFIVISIYIYVCVYTWTYMGSHDAWDASTLERPRGPTSLVALECFQGSFCPERSMVPRSCRKGTGVWRKKRELR